MFRSPLIATLIGAVIFAPAAEACTGIRLVAKDGYAIGATVDHPVVSARFVPPDADAEAALAVDGKDKWFVLAWRAPDGTSDIITEPAGLRPGPAAFLPGWPRAVAQAQDSGTGVR